MIRYVEKCGACAMSCHVVPLALIRKDEGQLSARLPRRSLAEGLNIADFIDLLDDPLAGNGQGIFKDGVQIPYSFIKCNAAFLGTRSYLIASIYEHLFTMVHGFKTGLDLQQADTDLHFGHFSSAKNGVQMECE